MQMKLCTIVIIFLYFSACSQHVMNTTEPGWVPINLQKHMFKTTDRAKNLTLMVHSYYHTKNASHAKTPYVTDTRKNDMTKVRIDIIYKLLFIFILGKLQ